MSTSTEDRLLSLDSTQQTWDLLAERVDALVTAWEGGAPPALGSFLPDEAPTVRRLILIELIKADLEQRVARQQPLKLIEDYAAEFPELAQGGVPCDLLYEEYHLRKRMGESIDLAEYRRRFPSQAQELARLLGVQSTFLSTAVHAVHLPGLSAVRWYEIRRRSSTGKPYPAATTPGSEYNRSWDGGSVMKTTGQARRPWLCSAINTGRSGSAPIPPSSANNSNSTISLSPSSA